MREGTIASPEVFEKEEASGYTSALLGVLIHFAISFVVAPAFILAARWIALVRRTEAAGHYGYCHPRSHRGRGVRWAASRHQCLAECPREQSPRDRVGEGIVPE